MKIDTQVYFDTEFTHLDKDADLISIGLVHIDPYRGENKALYIELNDYDTSKITPWVADNVIPYLVLNKDNHLTSTDNCILARCSKIAACNIIFNWLKGVYTDSVLNPLEGNKIQLVGDVCHYDFMLFIDLFGTALDLPDFISPVCLDINNRIAEFCTISPSRAFNQSREEMIQTLSGVFKLLNAPPMFRDDAELLIPEIMRKQHNALYDAFIINKLDSYMNDAEELRLFN